MSTVIVRDHRDAIEKGARLGYLARAAIFIVIGFFAFRTAFAGGDTISEREAISEIIATPFGSISLVLLVIALPAFAIWRLVQAVLDADGYGTSFKGLATRAGRLVSAFAYSFLAVYVGSILFGVSVGGSGGGSQILERWAQVFGPWLTIPLGLIMLGVAGSQIGKAYTGSFLRFVSLPPAQAAWMTIVCRMGLVARGIVFAAIAVLLLTGASRWNAAHPPGLEDGLEEIGSWPYGWLLLSATGAGLIAFGIYAIILARYGHIRSPDISSALK
ncbi:DUF1206 domain-containing protein [Aureimonas jatrophae]|uniref:DUF1206 domain-containing protein n=1 Tax=Aureimonas jatrophae TaxID=1166073 RepID=A0A1H0GRT3_9HYPH|nr:DUF1206 domain-containing protein [Aureimonas jatrophae]MBB3949746.1 hypothetical protein [Aureimonas jatrophae]SDO09766.1 protein of unknown function [Aureimonas jatrophae]